MGGVKKVFKKVVKVASKLDVGHQVLKGMGLPDPVGDALYGKNKTLSPAEQAAKGAKEQRAFAAGESRKQDSLNMQVSNASKLAGINSEKNTTNVEFGSVAQSSASDLKRRKKGSSPVSSSVGIQ